MNSIDRYLSGQKEKITSQERRDKKLLKMQETDARRADELFGPEEERKKNGRRRDEMTYYERAVVLKRIDGLWREIYSKRLIREVRNDRRET